MIVVCSGLIGAGKSTLCDGLCKFYNGVPFYEPLESENPYLKLFYEDPKTYGFGMQINMLRMRAVSFMQAFHLSIQDKFVVCDRSIYEDWAFAKVNNDSGNISDIDFDNYDKCHTLITSLFVPFPDLILNLKCSVDTCMTRIKDRGRSCEQKTEQNCGVTPDYLSSLSKAYDDVFDVLKTKCPCCDIDCEKDEASVLEQAIMAIEQVKLRKETTGRKPVYHGGF